jgi:regulator of nonsense transcripts 2
MAESMETRRTERRAAFDVPLPMIRRPAAQTPSMATPAVFGSPQPTHVEVETKKPTQPSGSVQFSILLKRGNKQQTRDIALPADSSFAVAMKHQQQAEREEQRRIKNLVLNLDNLSAGRDDGQGEHGNQHGKGENFSRFPSMCFLSSTGAGEPGKVILEHAGDSWGGGNPNRTRKDSQVHLNGCK